MSDAIPTDNSRRVLDLVVRRPGLKAKQIATELGLEKADVNSLLYGRLKSKLTQDKEYRWWPKELRPANNTSLPTTETPPTTPLARLSRYYLDCLSQDSEAGVSVFAASHYDLDYAPLSELPLVSDHEVGIFDDDRAKKLLNKARNDRGNMALYLGYPVRLRWMRSKKGWEGYMLEPVLLFPFLMDATNRFAEPSLSDDMPLFNFAVLKNLTTLGSGNVLDEAIRLSDELGLTNPEADLPDFDELCLKLRAARPEWDWVEQLDPYHLLQEPPLNRINEQGIYNRAVLVVGERSPFTQGLETELGLLAKVDDSKCQGTALTSWLKGAASGHMSIAPPEDSPILEVLPLNSEQKQAVKRALTNPLTVITGPPGTGKSQVVTSLLINAAWRGQSVLFASKNNKAVDVVEQRVNALGPRPILLRLGANEYQARLAQYLTALLAATSTPDDRSNFDHYRHVHEQLRSQLDELDSQVAHVIALRNNVDGLEQAVEAGRKEFGQDRFAAIRSWNSANSQNSLNILGDAVTQATRERQHFLMRLFWFMVKSQRFERLLRVGKAIQSWAGELGVAVPTCVPDDLTITEWHEFFNRLTARCRLARQTQSYFSSLAELSRAEPLEELTRRQMSLAERLADNSEKLWQFWLRLQPSRLSAAERNTLSAYSSLLQMIVASQEDNSRLGADVFRRYYQLFPQVAKTLTCWAVTSLSARRIPFEPGFFDLVVVDEASQCDIASALPLLYRAKRAVIIGDPQQLKHISAIPIRQDRQLLAKHELVNDHAQWAYAVNSLFDLARSRCGGEDIVSLRDHHRSHADIIGFSNDHFYEGRLRIATRYNKLTKPADTEAAVRWVHISGKVVRPGGSGAVNELEARATVEQVQKLVVERGYRGTVGVVSPFRAQANRIRDLVHANDSLLQRLAGADFLADTVHRFQGDERDVVFFSPVVSEGISESALGFLRSNGNLFNVAITRARAALVVVGDRRTSLNSGVDYLAKFAEYSESADARRHGEFRQAQRDLGPVYPPVARPELVSDWERHFYHHLYAAGLRPIPQYDVDQYTLDFALLDGDRMLNIEVDGERYHRNWDGELCRRDQLRNQRLFELGWDVMRFWVYQIRDELELCLSRVKAWQNKPTKACSR